MSHKETVRQQKIMSKTGKRPHYLYSNNINEVAETTEAYSADMVRSFDIEREVTNVTDQQKLSEVESTEEEQADQTDSAKEVKDDLLQISTSNVASLDEGSLFLVGRSSRFCGSTEINSRFLS